MDIARKTPGTLLFELGTEELPHSIIRTSLGRLAQCLAEAFTHRGIAFDRSANAVKTFATPRRLAIRIKNLPQTILSPARFIKGPRFPKALHLPLPSLSQLIASHGAWANALKGFVKGQGILPAHADIESLPGYQTALQLIDKDFSASSPSQKIFVKIFQETPYIVSHEQGRTTELSALLPELIREALSKLQFNETMRWGDLQETEKVFPRPIRYILLLLDDTVIPLTHAGLTSDRITYGHRWLSKDETAPVNLFTGAPLHIKHSEDWEPQLLKHHVIPDHILRETIIEEGLAKLAAEHLCDGWEIIGQDELIPIVSQLVEEPTLVVGRFDETFLKLPQEVLMSEMILHQKYFPIRNATSKKLLPLFIITCNIPPHTNPQGDPKTPSALQLGNERVLSARLRDGAFFYEQDQKIGLVGMAASLKKIVFIQKMGSLHEKMLRVQAVMTSLNNDFKFGCAELAITALASVAKADLASQMVGEFPKLQGIIGGTYARNAGLSAEISDAIEVQYLAAPHPERIKTSLCLLLVISEQLCDLIGCLSIDIKASGSEDPYALRRAATTLSSLLIKRNIPFSLGHFYDQHPELYLPFMTNKDQVARLKTSIISFLNARLKNVLKNLLKNISETSQETNFAVNSIPAVLFDDDWNPLASFELLKTLTEYYTSKQKSLRENFLAERRCDNILGPQYSHIKPFLNKPLPVLFSAIDTKTFAHMTEKLLFASCQNLFKLINSAAHPHAPHAPHTLIDAFYEATPDLSAFFEHVMITSPDPRERQNRLLLILIFQRIFNSLLHWEKLPLVTTNS